MCIRDRKLRLKWKDVYETQQLAVVFVTEDKTNNTTSDQTDNETDTIQAGHGRVEYNSVSYTHLDVYKRQLMDGAKDALVLLNDWYQKGIIPSDFATWEADTIKQVIGEDKAGIVFSPWWGCWDALSANISLNQEAEWSAYVLPGEEGGEIRSAA